MLTAFNRFLPKLAIVLTIAAMAIVDSTAQKRVYTLAGGGVQDGSLPSNGVLTSPRFAVYDTLGNLYVADYAAHRIRKITVSTITTIAGTGISGFGGDGGPATAATISFPTGVAVDASNNLYFSDSGNNRIRKIDTSGNITTIAGTGQAGFFGDNGSALLAQLNNPWGLFFDSTGNLFIADSLNQRIRKIDTAGVITTVAGNGIPGFGGDGGAATLASLNFPVAVVVNATKNMFIADFNNLRVRRVDNTGKINTYAGNGLNGCDGDGGLATAASLGNTGGLAISGANLVIATSGCSRIRSVNSSTRIITTLAGSTAGYDGGNMANTVSEFQGPRGLAIDKLGQVVVVDRGNNRIRKLNNSTHTVTNVAGGFIGDNNSGLIASLNQPTQIATDGFGATLIVDSLDNRIRKLPQVGNIVTVSGSGVTGYSGDNGPATAALLSNPQGIATDLLNNIFIADQGGSVVREITSSGTMSTIAQSNGTFATLSQIAVDTADNVYGADPISCAIWKITPAGVATAIAGIPGTCGYNGDDMAATSALLNRAVGVAIDASNNNIYIGDTDNHRIRLVDSHTGLISTLAGDSNCGFTGDGGLATLAEVCSPTGLTFYKSGVYFADTGNFRVRLIDKTSIMSTLAGSGIPGYNGNGLLQTDTNLDYPVSVAISKMSGTVYFLDLVQTRLRSIR